MPNLTIQTSPLGPLIDVIVGVSSGRQAALVAAGQPVPQAVPARILVDTGASMSSIDAQIISTLGLVQTGAVPMHTPTTGNSPVLTPLYDVSLTILHPVLQRSHQAIPVTACNYAAQGIQGLLGRDLLAGCVFVYNGEIGLFSLSF